MPRAGFSLCWTLILHTNLVENLKVFLNCFWIWSVVCNHYLSWEVVKNRILPNLKNHHHQQRWVWNKYLSVVWSYFFVELESVFFYVLKDKIVCTWLACISRLTCAHVVSLSHECLLDFASKNVHIPFTIGRTRVPFMHILIGQWCK